MEPFTIGSHIVKGAKEFQEDSLLKFVSPNNRVGIGCIWDGHGGYNGLLASNHAREVATEFFEENKLNCESWDVLQWHTKLKELFALQQDKIRLALVEEVKNHSNHLLRRRVDEHGVVRTVTGDPVHGGCTATVLVCIQPEPKQEDYFTIICANCGDSGAMIFNLKEEQKELITLAVSEEHGPLNQGEHKRIQDIPDEGKLLLVYDKTSVFRKYECPPIYEKTGSRVQNLLQNPWGNGLYPKNARYEPATYAVTPRSVTRDSTCIAITRSLGDFYACRFGVIAEPSINTHRLSNAGDFFLVVASDGVWDSWKSGEFSDFVRESVLVHGGDSQSLSESIVVKSMGIASALFGSRNVDDASLVCWRVCRSTRG